MHCDKIVKKAGFEPLPPEWPSCYFNKALCMFLIIYVDDFKMAGKRVNFQEAWKRLIDGGSWTTQLRSAISWDVGTSDRRLSEMMEARLRSWSTISILRCATL